MAPRVKSKGLQALVNEFVGDDPKRVAEFEQGWFDLQIGAEINRMRTEAGLTMKQLADRIGTQQSAISRLEQADYRGHSLNMLCRVAAALGRRVEVNFPPISQVKTVVAKAPAKGDSKRPKAKAPSGR